MRASSARAADPLTTEAERSGFVRTGRYAEVIALCDAFARRNPAAPPCRTWNLGTAMGALQNTYSRAVAELIELDDEDGEE